MPLTALVALLFAATMFALAVRVGPGVDHPRHPVRRALRAGHRGDPDHLPGRRGGRGSRPGEPRSPSSACGPRWLLDAATFAASGLLIGLGTRARPAAARPGRGPGLAAGPGGRRAPAGVRRPGPAHPGARSAGSWSSTRSRKASPPRIRRGSAAARSPPGWYWPPPSAGHDDHHPAIQPVRPPAPTASADGTAGRRACATLVLTVLSPEPGCIAGDLLGCGGLRRLPARGQYRLRGQGAGRAAGSGLRHSEHGRRGGAGGCLHGRRRRR